MLDINEFSQVADHILTNLAAVYTEYGIDLPAHRYLAVGGAGSTVHDCEQVTVSFEQSYSGLPGNQASEPVKCNAPRTGVYIVEVVRRVPTANSAEATTNKTQYPSRFGDVTNVRALPSEKQTEVAKKQMQDAMLMMEAGLRAGETSMSGTIVDVSAGQASGGYQAMVMTVIATAVSPTTQSDMFGG